jgi:GAF domain-containing protein
MAAEDTSALLLDTFVELADTLASGYDVGDLLQFLVDRCSELLLADNAGVLLETPGGDLPTLAAATSQDMLDIEELEIGLGQGPCLEAYRTGEPVLVEDLARCRARWPEFTPRIVDLGMRSAYAFPLRLRGDRIGALNLYRAEVKMFASHEVRLGQALADIAAVGILQERAVFAAERRAEQLQRALDSRIMIEQAKGVLAERRHIPAGEAFELLRRHARSNNLTLRDACRHVINGELDL